jgi:hypothetical protein
MNAKWLWERDYVYTKWKCRRVENTSSQVGVNQYGRKAGQAIHCNPTLPSDCTRAARHPLEELAPYVEHTHYKCNSQVVIVTAGLPQAVMGIFFSSPLPELPRGPPIYKSNAYRELYSKGLWQRLNHYISHTCCWTFSIVWSMYIWYTRHFGSAPF